MKDKNGFTLIELLVALALLGVVSLTIYSSFTSGINVWQRISTSIGEEDLGIFFERLSRQFQNTFPYSSIPFQGDEEKCSFPTIISTSEALGGNLGIGRVTYYMDDSSGGIGQVQENLSQLYQEKGAELKLALKNASSLSFKYYGLDVREGRYTWQESWDSSKQNGKLPQAVQLSFEFKDNQKVRYVTRTISIPIGE